MGSRPHHVPEDGAKHLFRIDPDGMILSEYNGREEESTCRRFSTIRFQRPEESSGNRSCRCQRPVEVLDVLAARSLAVVRFRPAGPAGEELAGPPCTSPVLGGPNS
jgi:hypothetical protein